MAAPRVMAIAVTPSAVNWGTGDANGFCPRCARSLELKVTSREPTFHFLRQQVLLSPGPRWVL